MEATIQQTSDYVDRRVAESPERFQVKRLWDRHKVICQMMATGLYTQKEIAKKLEISEVTVSYTVRSPLVRHQINLLQAGRDEAAIDLVEQIRDMAPKAIALLDSAMDSEDQPMTTRLQASRELRGWMEFVLPKKRENVTLGALLSLDDIKEIKAEAQRANAGKPEIAKFEEVS